MNCHYFWAIRLLFLRQIIMRSVLICHSEPVSEPVRFFVVAFSLSLSFISVSFEPGLLLRILHGKYIGSTVWLFLRHVPSPVPHSMDVGLTMYALVPETLSFLWNSLHGLKLKPSKSSRTDTRVQGRRSEQTETREREQHEINKQNRVNIRNGFICVKHYEYSLYFV